MADKKITQLDEVTSASPTDVGVIVSLSSGSTSKITLQNMFLAGNQGLSYVKEVELYRSTLSASGIFDISSISQDYDHLKIIAAMKSTVSAAVDDLHIILNDDTVSANYYRQNLLARDAATSLTESSGCVCAAVTGGTSASSAFATLEIFIPFYSQNNLYKTIHDKIIAYTTKDGQLYVGEIGVAWESVLPINKITFRPDGYPTDMLAANSFCQVIGIKTIS